MPFKKIETSLTDCYIIEPQVFGDARGFFMETYSETEFAKIGITAHFVQDNHSKSKKGVLRGLHFQTRKPQAKLVRVSHGSVYDVVVDLRKGSPTFGKWEGFLLSAENKKMLFVPRGFAHGFLTLEDDTEFLYKCDDLYDPKREGGIIWDDSTLVIDWSRVIGEYSIDELEISEKDTKNKEFLKLGLQNPFVYGEQIGVKRFNEWIQVKSKQHFHNQKPKKVTEGQIWWLYFGENMGREMNGKGDDFQRPCIIYKKLTSTQFLVIPTSTKMKEGSWYVSFCQHQQSFTACLQQIRVVDISRLRNLKGQLDDADMTSIQKAFEGLYI